VTIAIGDKLPEATFKEKTADGMAETKVSDLFAGKKVVLFAVPGAFTPTCHLNHLPGYIENRDAILAKGVDEIAVVSVNDAFVMGAWEKATNGTGKLRYLSDWDASFTKAIGMGSRPLGRHAGYPLEALFDDCRGRHRYSAQYRGYTGTGRDLGCGRAARAALIYRKIRIPLRRPSGAPFWS
jgi:peroxiredoxin